MFNYSRDLPPVEEDGVRWFFLSEDEKSTELIPGSQPDHYQFFFDPGFVSLEILNLTLSDSGLYTVEVSNIVGADDESVSLDVQSEFSSVFSSFFKPELFVLFLLLQRHH